MASRISIALSSVPFTRDRVERIRQVGAKHTCPAVSPPRCTETGAYRRAAGLRGTNGGGRGPGGGPPPQPPARGKGGGGGGRVACLTPIARREESRRVDAFLSQGITWSESAM